MEEVTLREFISSLEKLSDNGKNDNLKVMLHDDDGARPLGWYGIDTVYPFGELEECNPMHGKKCILIDV